jgi:hypothetical protein
LKGLNGHLFPLGLIKLLLGIPKLRNYRLFGLGVIPEYHGKGMTVFCTGPCVSRSIHLKPLWK